MRTNFITPLELKPLEKKNKSKLKRRKSFLCLPSMFLIKFYNNINRMLSEFFMSSWCDDELDSTSQ